MSVDASELDSLVNDLMAVPAKMTPKIKPIVTKAARNVKNIMRSDVSKSRHFRQIGRTVNYEVKAFQFAGDASIEAEIGYDKQVSGAASLAGIAIFGTSKPGGGTVRDPVEALLEEAPNFLEYIGQACDGLL